MDEKSQQPPEGRGEPFELSERRKGLDSMLIAPPVPEPVNVSPQAGGEGQGSDASAASAAQPAGGPIDYDG
jgi:hypothetical protein